MRKLFTVFIVLSLITGCGNSEPDVFTPAAGPNRSSVEAAFERAVTEIFEARSLPGVAAGLWQPGRPPFLLLLGEADKETGRALNSADRFRIGSVTKSFTVTLILQLAEERVISLDDPIGQYIPGIHNPDATLEELANMTSGIFNYSEEPDYQQLLVSDFAQTWTNQQLIDYAVLNDPYFAPGAGWHYSNTNTVALGMVVEQVTGNSLAQEIQQRIALPLALENTVYPSTADMPVPYAVGYGIFDPGEYEDVSRTDPSASAGSGAVVSTLEDLSVWGRALGSGELLTQESFNRQIQMVPTDGCPTCPEYDGYGLGIGNLDGWIGHTGDYIGYQALVMYDPRTGTTAVILINQKDFTNRAHYPTDMFRDFIAHH